ncbi:MAG: DUF697 domain-containing protein [Desulfobacterales bacterium]|nr:DUF697 domain-containing protein [Desulfobacterales bacterium]
MVAAKEKEKVEEAVVEEIDKLVEAKRIIKNRVIISAGLGLVPVPMVDLVGLATIQLEMLARLTKLYEIPFRKNVGKSLIASLMGGVLPVSVVPGTFSLLKAVPLIGWATGAATMSLLGGAATYAVGKVFTAHFEAGGTLLNFNPEAMREYFAEQFEEGKTVASAAGAGAKK